MDLIFPSGQQELATYPKKIFTLCSFYGWLQLMQSKSQQPTYKKLDTKQQYRTKSLITDTNQSHLETKGFDSEIQVRAGGLGDLMRTQHPTVGQDQEAF